MGMKGSPTTELYFENCHIPGDRIIGEPGTGLKTALKTLDHTRPTVGAQAVGVAQGALEAAVGYTKDRNQFGKSISSFQAVRTGRHGDEGGGGEVDGVHRRGPRPARRARPQFHLGGRQVLRLRRRHECHRVSGPAVGGAGYTRDFPLERMMRDAKITQIYEGTKQIQHIVMSRALLAV